MGLDGVEGRNSWTGRDALIEQVHREIGLALQLAGQLQIRAQVIASTVTLLLSLAGILVASESPVFDQLTAADLRGAGLWILALAGGCLILSLFAAIPRQLPFTDPTWITETLRGDPAYRPILDEDRESFIRVLRRVDETTVQQLHGLLKANRRRGNLLLISLLLLGALAILVAWVSVHLIVRL